ncbi:MAG: hypothetical protein WAL75_06045 [Terracidiphilus sp.]
MSMYSPTITLLSDQSNFRQPQTSFVASISVHGAVIALVYLALLYAPRVDIHATVHYDMRVLTMDSPQNNPSRLDSSSIRYPGPLSAQKTPGMRGDEAAHLPSPKLIPHTQIGPQTLMQPDLKIAALLDHEIPLPKVVLWSASKVQVKKIVAPKPQKPPSVDVKPQVEIPNQEVKLADIPLASTNNLLVKPLAPASNTTPIVAPQPSQQIDVTPVSTAQSQLQPTPAAVMSLSDIAMKDANVALPPVNQTARGDANGSMTAANSKPQPGPGNENAAFNATGNGSSKTAGSHPGVGTSNSGVPSAGGGKSLQPGSGGNGAANGSGQTAGNGNGDGDRPTATKIALPPEGRFGAVVVGTSLEDQYPGMGDVWQGRMAYTVFLHVGLAKSWVLQYALPRTVDAAVTGSIGQLDAPWPFNIVRPNLAPGAIDSDALMVHGFINTAGRFENLQVVFPPAFPMTDFVLQSLTQWQFRPAARNGKPIRTEVLIVIPDEED